MLGASVAVVTASLVLAVAVHVGVLLRIRAVAAAAADHAALAAAGALATPGRDPSDAASTVAVANGARVTSCRCGELPVRVDVAVPVPPGLAVLRSVVGPVVTASGRARLVSLPPADHPSEIH